MSDTVDTYCVRCDGNIGFDPERPGFCTVCWERRRELPPQVQEAIRVLAALTKNAPSYDVTVQPFADAHQEACAVLDRLQKSGVGAAS